MIIHVDMDAFYASVEERENPGLRDRPVIIGHLGPRGVVSTANYHARRFGVHSAMPSLRAARLCPQGVWIAPRIAFYAEISAQIRAIFADYTPDVEPLSLDEAYLDLSGTESLFGPAEDVARTIKARILATTGLTASVGVGPTKIIAKIASDHRKPDGFVVVAPDEVDTFLAPLPVASLWGVGPQTTARLANFGIRTVAQLRGYPLDWLIREFGRAGGQHLFDMARGVDRRRVEAGDHKQVSNEQTFAHDIADPDAQAQILQELVEEVAWRLRRGKLRGRTVTVKLRYPDFRTYTRSVTLGRPSDITREIFEAALQLLQRRPDPGPLRLIGIGVSNFGNAPLQPDLFQEPERMRAQRLDAVLDKVQEKFGPGALARGRRPRGHS